MEFAVRSRRRPRIEIIPMIDVMFFLVAFFMVFSTFKTTPAALNVQLPRAQTATAQAASELVITVTAQGQLYLDGKRVNLSELTAHIRDALRQRPDLFLVIRGDERTEYGSVIAVIDAIRSVSGEYGARFGLAVRDERAAAL